MNKSTDAICIEMHDAYEYKKGIVNYGYRICTAKGAIDDLSYEEIAALHEVITNFLKDRAKT